VAADAEFSAIVRALNGVKTAGPARAAAGAALNAAHDAYNVLDDLTDERAAAGKHELDLARADVQTWYARIAETSYAAPIANEWATGRLKIQRLYQVIGGLEAEAHYTPQTSNVDILLQSVKEAPQVFGSAVGSVTKEAGKVVGSAAGGILSGLGVSGTITVVLVLVGVVVFLKRGTIVGRLLG
jgi:hypothetical protein